MEVITDVQTAEDLSEVKKLFQDYTANIPPDILALQDFKAEIDGLPGQYSSPDGALLLARFLKSDGRCDSIAGCVAIRPFVSTKSATADGLKICEMKRFYVAPTSRGTGIGQRLAEAILARARSLGYEKIVLDTLPGMEKARRLYLGLGFEKTSLMDKGSVPEMIFLEKDLRGTAEKV